MKACPLSNANWRLSEIISLINSPNQRISLIEDYINTEYSKLSDKHKDRHIYSDIIESIFGYFKARKSLNAMNGINKQIFLLSLMTHIKNLKSNDFKIFTENICLKDLDDWRDVHLSENTTVMRIKLLSA
jgi:hypothetical protein